MKQLCTYLIVLAFAAAFAACSSGGYSSSPVIPNNPPTDNPRTYNITVQKESGTSFGDIKVCFDRNRDKKCGNGEPAASSTTEKFTLKGVETDSFSELLAEVYDSSSGKVLRIMEAPAGNILISPITTLIKGIYDSDPLADAEGTVKTGLSISGNNILNLSAVQSDVDKADKALKVVAALVKDKLLETFDSIPADVIILIYKDVSGVLSSSSLGGKSSYASLSAAQTDAATALAGIQHLTAVEALKNVTLYSMSHYEPSNKKHEMAVLKFENNGTLSQGNIELPSASLPQAEPGSTAAHVNGSLQYHGGEYIFGAVTKISLAGKTLAPLPKFGTGITGLTGELYIAGFKHMPNSSDVIEARALYNCDFSNLEKSWSSKNINKSSNTYSATLYTTNIVKITLLADNKFTVDYSDAEYINAAAFEYRNYYVKEEGTYKDYSFGSNDKGYELKASSGSVYTLIYRDGNTSCVVASPASNQKMYLFNSVADADKLRTYSWLTP